MRASTLAVHARAWRGTSSAAFTPMMRFMAAVRPRGGIWVAISRGRLGARAPKAVKAMASTAAVASTARRPRRSASATAEKAITASTRLTASATPWPSEPTPNSSPAKAMVWVSRVPR